MRSSTGWSSMPPKMLRTIADRVREACSTVVWRQWAALGSMAASDTAARSLIDPEALVLISLSLSNYERRLRDVITDWSSVGSRLLSVQRFKNLAGSYPDSTMDSAREYASFVLVEMGDVRWRSIPRGKAHSAFVSRRKRWTKELSLLSEAALMLRLRLGLGVNMRSDVLSFLLSIQGNWVTVAEVARALSYTKAATRRAAGDLAGAGLIRVEARATPDTYSADPKSWSYILEYGKSPPAWRNWQHIFAFTAALDEWESASRDRKLSPYAVNTRGKELMEKHWLAFEGLKHAAARPSKSGDSFETQTTALCEWMVGHV